MKSSIDKLKPVIRSSQEILSVLSHQYVQYGVVLGSYGSEGVVSRASLLFPGNWIEAEATSVVTTFVSATMLLMVRKDRILARGKLQRCNQ